MKRLKYLITILWLGCISISNAQSSSFWHDSIRTVHYLPKGDGFELSHGNRRFNRALYGTNTGFRVEAGDLPEFAMYMPGMGGNFKLGIASKNGESKWITTAEQIRTLYRPGVMSYTIKDPMLHNGEIQLSLVALAESEGFILKLQAQNIPESISLLWVYGGASGKKFWRSGDIGADPESVFYLQPQYCLDNDYQLKESSFKVNYGSRNNKHKTGNNKSMYGVFPESEVKIASASHQETPLTVYRSKADNHPLITGKLRAIQKTQYWKFENSEKFPEQNQEGLQTEFSAALKAVQTKASIIKVNTPDPFINTLGGALSIAADAVWESPAFLHGSIAWRMHLNAWRGASVADPLGWKDRAESHFYSYANSQVIHPATGPVVPDTTRNYARQKEEIGTSMFSSGYISRHPNNNTVAHHYDMNSVFFNQVLRHYLWTGDTAFIKKMWPYLKRHLNWEKRNFDADNNYLYDAYACIWASDALQYSGGSVSYSSAYNLNANKLAYAIGKKLELPESEITPYKVEAELIQKALNDQLWIENKGVFAEYKDILGNQLLHDQPGIWSIYHPIDEGAANPFQAYQMLRYVDTEIPHIPVKAIGLPLDDLALISTTNWQPYTWSVNNVALAEILHTSLAYWQGQRPEKAFKLWQSAIVESMYLGASPGGFQQLSFYDAMRGELYRDFADPIAMAARSLTEGLFGIRPNALADTLSIQPGFPSKWEHAEIKLPNLSYSYNYKRGTSYYKITPSTHNPMALKLTIAAKKQEIEYIKINQQLSRNWSVDTNALVTPKLIIYAPYQQEYTIEIKWKGEDIHRLNYTSNFTIGNNFDLSNDQLTFKDFYDPQSVFKSKQLQKHHLSGALQSTLGNKTFFLKLQQGNFQWWEPIDIQINQDIEITATTATNKGSLIEYKSNKTSIPELEFIVNKNTIKSSPEKGTLSLEADELVSGTNSLYIKGCTAPVYKVQNWKIKAKESDEFQTIDLSSYYNNKVNRIFKEQYSSPRVNSPTLQLPLQGIGNWCYPNIRPDIDASGLKDLAAKNKGSVYFQNIPFAIAPKENNDIVFTSMWDNYPESVTVPLKGKARHMYLLMTGTTNPMQSHLTNGRITIHYKDGSSSQLLLKNPENWWPIEQDYYTDHYAFKISADSPLRLHLKTGEFHLKFKDYTSIKGFTDYAIDGGAATVLDLSIDPSKELDHLELTTLANEVIIGIMSITLLK
ncbi:DUF4450 domain-containing protein [Galbibacter sp.]|uniref:DUF4450 domain-containing protein n=1 Tax=Galbibacter sp. TaxID=2918471 RepID=UPI003A9155FA